MKKKKSIQENTELASRYRTNQNDYITLKDKLMNNFEDRVKLESAIKDLRQVRVQNWPLDIGQLRMII